MIRQVLAQFPFMDLVLVAQLLFLGVFLSVLFWVFRKGSSSFYSHLSRLPLDGEENSHE
jgi:cbb3-type cytochrome oxidase subunit 3